MTNHQLFYVCLVYIVNTQSGWSTCCMRPWCAAFFI